MRRASWILTLLAPLGCGGGERRPDILLVTLDTTRADRLGCYGYEPAETPVMDALAREGALFESCMAAAPITLPSHATLLTGLQPYRHGVRNNGSHRLPADVETLAELLAPEGYTSGAVVSAAVLRARYGLDQGFAHYDDQLVNEGGASLLRAVEARADDTTERAISWLSEQPADQPLFLWVHYFDPHGDYEPPSPFAERFADAPYDGEIAFVDQELGRLLVEFEGRGRATAVAVTSDHGESLGEHGERTHGLFTYDATIRVPLLLRHPSLAKGTRVSAVVQGVDVLPTLLDLAGVAAPAGLDGRSLVTLARGATAEWSPRSAYSEAMYPFYNHGWSDLRSLRSAEGRYVRAPRPELYDLASDPGELENVHDARPEEAQSFADELGARLAPGERDSALGGATPSDEVRAELAALGYVWEEPTDRTLRELPDPKDRLEAWTRYELAIADVQSGLLARGIAALQSLAHEDPDAALVREQLGWALVAAGRQEEAIATLREALTLPGLTNGARLYLAQLECEAGDLAWHTTLQLAREAEPDDPNVWVTEGDCLLEAGEWSAAEAAYGQALARGAGFDALSGMARAASASKDGPRAKAAFARAVDAASSGAHGRLRLAVLCEDLGRIERAERHYREALELDPALSHAGAELARLLIRQRRFDEAQPLLRAVIEQVPNHYGARRNLAILFLDDDPEEAAQHLEVCLRERPDDPDTRMMMMSALRRTGRDAAALALARELLEGNSELFPALRTAAVSSARLGRMRAARGFAERALELRPERFDVAALEEPVLRELVDG